MTQRHSLFASVAAFSFLIVFPAVGFAQHGGHGAPAPATPRAPAMQGEQMKRNVDSMMANSASMLRELSAMQMAGGQFDQVLTGIKGMLDQLRGMSGNLAAMLNDPMLMQGNDKKALNQASRDLEKMASAFQSMTKNLNQAMTGR